MQVYQYEKPATLGILTLTTFSSIRKMKFDVENFNKLLSYVNKSTLSYVLFFVGLMEIASVYLILDDVFMSAATIGRLSSKSEHAVKFLIGYLLFETLLLYTFPLKYQNVAMNVALMSGLLFVYQIIKRNVVQLESFVKNETVERINDLMKHHMRQIGPSGKPSRNSNIDIRRLI